MSAVKAVLVGIASRIHIILLAALFATGLRVLPSRWLCAETTCSSTRDAVVFWLVVLAAFVGVGALLWRTSCRAWWCVPAVLVAAYASIQVPRWLGRGGHWSVRGGRGDCEVRYGMGRAEVAGACGEPYYSCEGPKHFDPANWWNPLTFTTCSFEGLVYDGRLIVFGCNGGVQTVEAVPSVSPEQSRPLGCVWWRHGGAPPR